MDQKRWILELVRHFEIFVILKDPKLSIFEYAKTVFLPVLWKKWFFLCDNVSVDLKSDLLHNSHDLNPKSLLSPRSPSPISADRAAKSADQLQSVTKWLLRLARWCNHCNQLIRFNQLQTAETQNRFVFLLDTSINFQVIKNHFTMNK